MARKLGEKKGRVAPDRWHAFVAVPAYDGKVNSNFAGALADSAFSAPLFEVKMTTSIMANGAFIDLARNLFAATFLRDFPECTHLFFIDSDLKWSPNAFVGLIRAGHPICAGTYPRRQEETDYPIVLAEHPEEGGLWVETITDETGTQFNWVMAERVPTGFLCIRRDVIETLSQKVPTLDIHGVDFPVPQLFSTKLTYKDVKEGCDAKFCGEDYSFCDLYMEHYKKPIHVWPDIDFEHGSPGVVKTGNFLEYLEHQIEIEEKEHSAA